MSNRKSYLAIFTFLIAFCCGFSQASSKIACVSPNEPIYSPWTSDLPQRPICENPKLIDVPGFFRQTIDLTEHKNNHTGSCSKFLKDTKFIEIDASLGFPIQIRLPIIDSKDESCSKTCQQQDFPDLNPDLDTYYGLVFKFKGDFYPGALGGNLVFRAEEPWLFITGNEGKAVACLNGYPSILEYGKPLACANTHVTQFGIASNSLVGKSVTVTIDLVPWTQMTSPCCPYMCPNNAL